MGGSSELKVLIIEESQVTAEILKDFFLMTWKSNPLFFPTARAAYDFLLEKAVETPPDIPDIVILDLGHSDKECMAVLRDIRNHDAMRFIPIIVRSSTDKLEVMLEIKKLDRVAYVRKKIGESALTDTILKFRTLGFLKK